MKTNWSNRDINRTRPPNLNSTSSTVVQGGNIIITEEIQLEPCFILRTYLNSINTQPVKIFQHPFRDYLSIRDTFMESLRTIYLDKCARLLLRKITINRIDARSNICSGRFIALLFVLESVALSDMLIEVGIQGFSQGFASKGNHIAEH